MCEQFRSVNQLNTQVTDDHQPEDRFRPSWRSLSFNVGLLLTSHESFFSHVTDVTTFNKPGNLLFYSLFKA